MFHPDESLPVRRVAARSTDRRLRLAMLMSLLPLVLSGCEAISGAALEQALINQFVGYAAMQFAKPVVDPIFNEILGGGAKKANAAGLDSGVVAGVEQAWRDAHGGTLRYACGRQSPAQCEDGARNEAMQIAKDHARRFEQAYASCKAQVRERGPAGFAQSIRQINDCTANQGFRSEMDTITRLASGQ